MNDMALRPWYLVDLCAGGGMLGVAVHLALGNVQTVAYVEREASAAATLVARMGDAALDKAPIWDDVKTACDPEFVDYVRQFRPLIVCGGYPCQPFSVAGKRSGVNDERHLWPAIDRLIGKVQPELCFFENVPGHLRLGFAEVRRNLEQRGYSVTSGLFSAEEVGASIERERLHILAVANSHSPRKPQQKRSQQASGGRNGNSGEKMACLGKSRHPGGWKTSLDREAHPEGREYLSQRNWPESSGRPGATGQGLVGLFPPHRDNRAAWDRLLKTCPARIEPALPRLADGVAAGLDADRLRISGNGVCTLAAAYAFVSLVATAIRDKQEVTT